MKRSPKRAVSSRQKDEKELMALLGSGEVKAKPGKKRWIFIGGGALLACIELVLILFVFPGSENAGTEAVYREYTVERGDIIVGQSESSSISLARETVTFSVSSTVEEIYVKAGSSVKEGDPLMKLNTGEIAAGLAGYELELKQAALEIEQAKLEQQTKLLQARQNYESSVQDGKLASTEEGLTVAELKLALSSAQSALANTQAEYDEYVSLHASYPSDYAYLTKLESRVTYYEEKLAEYEEALADLEALQAQYEPGQNVDEKQAALTAAKAALKDKAQKYHNAGGTISETDKNYILDEGIEVDYTHEQDISNPDLADIKKLYEAALSYYKTAKSEYNTANTSAGNAAKLKEEMDEILDDVDADSIAALKSLISSVEVKLKTAQSNYTDYKEEYNDTYGNVKDEDDLAAKLASLKQDVEKAELALSKAGVSLTTGTTNAEQQAELAKSGASTAKTALELTEMELQQKVDAAQEAYDVLYAQIEDLKESIALDGVVLSPCTGMVASVSVEEGDSFDVTYNEDLGMLMKQTLCTLTNISDVYVPITISEEDILDVSIGQEATVTMNAFNGQNFDAEVDTITVESSRSGAATVSYTVNVRLSGENTRLMYEGMSADVTLVQRAALDVLYVNKQAITNAGGVATVQKLGSDGVAVTTEVKTGFSDGRYVEILSGLSEGDTVLSESAVGRS